MSEIIVAARFFVYLIEIESQINENLVKTLIVERNGNSEDETEQNIDLITYLEYICSANGNFVRSGKLHR